jgi:hypothetical protein
VQVAKTAKHHGYDAANLLQSLKIQGWVRAGPASSMGNESAA